MPELSVIVPVYNEAKTIREIIEKINAVDVDKEVIVVDDGSSDESGRILRGMRLDNLKVIHHTTNRGKGSAIATALANAQGEYCIIQDADLEYDPGEYLRLLEPVKLNQADLALGARFTKGYHGLWVHRLGNMFLTGLVNLLFHIRLNDCFTCYKLARLAAFKSLGLRASSFDIEIEIIAKALRNKLRIQEIPIHYSPRAYSQGKKIRLRDGAWAAASIFRYRMGL